MHRLRVLRALVAAATLVVGTVHTAFAAGANYPDVNKDTALAAAVDRLTLLDILKGYPDGTFKPENPVTRAEFAAIAVRAAGLSAAAQANLTNQRFSDVSSDHWAAGYINAAATAGLVTGYPDGTFKPDAQVTQAEALAVLVRALGYTPVVKGEWPNNYVNQAAALGLTNGVAVAATAPANRGTIAQFVNNTLDVETLAQRGYGDLAFYEPSGKKFVEEKLGLKVWTRGDARVTANARIDDSLAPGEVTVEYDPEDEDEDDDIEEAFLDTFGSLSPDFKLGPGVDAEKILGTEIHFWVKDDTIVYAQVVTPERRIITGYLDDDTSNKDPIWGPGGEDELDGDGTREGATWWIDEEDYEVAADADIYVNNDEATDDDLDDIKDDDFAIVRVVLNDDGDIAFADVWNWDHVMIVTEVDADDESVEGVDGKSDWEDEQVDFDDPITWGGEEFDVGSVEVGDALFVAIDPDDDHDFVVLQKPHQGVLEEAESPDVGDVTVKIDGKEYDATAYAGFSADGNDEADFAYDWDEDDVAEDLVDLVGEDVNYYFDIAGDVWYISGEAEGTGGSTYALAVAAERVGSNYVVTFLTEDGELVDYETTDDTDYEDDNDYDEDEEDWALSEDEVEALITKKLGNPDDGGVTDGNFALVTFSLDDSGDLAKVWLEEYRYVDGGKLYQYGFRNVDPGEGDLVDGGNVIEAVLTALSDDNRTATVKEKVYGSQSNTVTVPKGAIVFDTVEEDTFSGDDLVNGELEGDGTISFAWTVSSGRVAEVVVIFNAKGRTVDYGFDDEDTGVVVARNFSSSGDTVELVLLGGEKKTFKIDRDDLQDLRLGDVISFDWEDDELTDFDREDRDADDLKRLKLEGGDDEGYVLYYSVGADVYGITLEEDAVLVDSDNDYEVVTISEVAEDEDVVDEDFEGYTFDAINVDDDELVEFVILRP